MYLLGIARFEVGELSIAGFTVRKGGRWSLDDVDGSLVCAKICPTSLA